MRLLKRESALTRGPNQFEIVGRDDGRFAVESANYVGSRSEALADGPASEPKYLRPDGLVVENNDRVAQAEARGKKFKGRINERQARRRDQQAIERLV
jgi:hypothetical protein